METEINFQEKDILNHSDRPIVSARRSAVLGFITFLVLAFLFTAIIYQRTINLKQDNKEAVLTVANNARVRLQESLAFSLSATKTLSFFIQKDGSVKNFDSIAPQILAAGNDIDAVQLAPGGIIRYVYPLKGNEKIIGYDILKDSSRNKEAIKAIQKNELFFAGPMQLRQGGIGVVGRLPVFRNRKFWGFTAVVIRLPALLKAAGITSVDKNGYYFQLSKKNPDTGKEEFFISQQENNPNSYSVSVNVPNGEWKLSAIPVHAYKGFGDIILLAILGLLLAILGGIFVFNESGRPKKLHDLVKERTRQLKEGEENYKVLFEKSPLPLWIYDRENFRILEVNDAAISLYGYSHEEFLQMDVLGIRPKEDIEKFLADNRNVTPELREAGIWTHLKKNKEAIEVLIFSKDIFYKGRQGRLVLLMDISEKIKIENELIKSEEKYRSLIEQASDGIILYSFDGTIHSFNKAAYSQTGYSREEFETLNLKDLFFEKGITQNRLNNNKVSSDQTTTLYRKLKRKDGSILLVELNARMLPDGKIVAIVRDITEREKTEAALKESEEKFSKAFHSNVLGFAIYDADFRIIDINDVYAGMLESSKEELLGKSSDDAGLISKIHPGQRQAISDQIEQILSKEKQLHNFEINIETGKGEPASVLLSVEYMELSNKIYWLVSAIDITVIKKAEVLVQERELKYRSLIEQASDGIIITDLQGNMLEVNQSIARMGGYDIEEMQGKHVSEFIPQEDIEANPFRFDELLQGGSLLHERRYLKKDGTAIDIEVNSKLTNLNTLIGFIRDISERKLAEEAIKISEEKYRTLVDQASDGIFIADKAGKFLVVNSSGYTMSQYSPDEMGNLSIYDLVLPDDIKKNPFHFSEMMNNKVARAERRMVRKDGTLLDVEVTAKFISGDRFLAFVRDITERKKNEDILRYQARLLDSVSDAITSLNTEREIVSWNAACEELYGLTSEEAIGRRIPQLVTFEFPDTTNEKAFEQVFREGWWKGEFNFIHPKTGFKIHLLSSINLLKNKEGAITGLIITSKDITDRKKAEEEIAKSNERFELIAQATNDAVWDHDFINNETWGNKKLYSIYGVEAGKEKLDFETFISRIHPEERNELEQRMKEAIKQSVTSLTDEFRFKTGNGEYRNFYDRAYIKYDADGKPARLLGAMQDITDREIIKRQILKEKELSDSIINSLPGVFYLFNKEGKYLRWNKNLEIVTGYTGEEISNMHPLDFFENKDHPLLTEKISNVFAIGEDYVEANFLLKSKQKIPFYFNGQTIEYEGEICLMGVGLDFSEREKAKKEILDSETKYRELIEHASDGIFISNQDGRYIDVNTGACRMLGYTKEELLTRSGADILYNNKDSEALKERYKELKSGKNSIREIALKRKDGSIVMVESNSKMLPDGRFIGIVRDLTERKKADKALRESEERYRALVENAPEALVVMDVNKQAFVSVSESATKLFKMSKEELLKLGPMAVSPEYQPDGRLSSEAATENIQKAIDGEKPSFEWMHCDKDRNPIPCEIWLVRLPSETEVLIRGSIVDITERKKVAEEIKTNSELLRELYSYSQNIREEERTYIAREIHDELGQQLTGLKMDLSWITRKLKPEDEAISEKLAGTIGLIDTTIQTVRKIATELRPSILDDLGLVAALEWQGEEFGKRSDIKVNFTSKLGEKILQPDITTALFRIYQELLTNIARHAGAKTVNTLIYINDNKLHLSVEDDGKGFDAENIISKKTLGLRGIKERTNLIGGAYEIKTRPGEGTFVLISVPLYNIIINP